MKSTRSLPHTIFWLSALAVILLTGCNMPGNGVENFGIDVTQAYQTVQAQLTQAVAQPLLVTTSPTPILLVGETPVPTPEISQTAGAEAPLGTPPSEKRCDQAAAAYPNIDITIPDDSKIESGQKFTKIWRVVNVGTCTWTPAYELVFFSGDSMGALTSLPIDATVPPDHSVELSLDMIAPEGAGTYQGNWKLRNPAGLLFGIGPGGESPFWVRIQVVRIATETPTATASLTPTTAVQADGPVTLVVSDTLNLDNLQVNAAGADLEFTLTLTEPPRYQLVPVGSAVMSFFGGIQPLLAECQGASKSAEAIPLGNLAAGTYMCYRTDLGLPGWVRLDGYDPDAGSVTLQVFTWKLP